MCFDMTHFKAFLEHLGAFRYPSTFLNYYTLYQKSTHKRLFLPDELSIIFDRNN